MAGFFTTSEVLTKTSSLPRLSKCGTCTLNKDCETPRIPIVGKGRKKILIVAESPSELEDDKGKQLVGEEGAAIRGVFKNLGVDIDRDCWRTFGVICHSATTLSYDKIESCASNLFKTIDKLKPTVIIPMGGAAIQALIGSLRQEQIGDKYQWIGRQIPYQRLNTWICPTFFTGYITSNDFKTPIARNQMRAHLRAAFKLAPNRPWVDIPDYESEVERLINKPSKVARYIKYIIEKGGTIAFDYEANCLKPEYKNAELYSCSICWGGKKTFAFPWSSSVIDPMRDLFRSPVKKIGANIKFEDRWTRKIVGCRIRNWNWDTMLAAHVEKNTKGTKGLKWQAFVKLGVDDYDSHIKPLLKGDKKTHINRIDEIAMDDLLLYNGMDSLLTYELSTIQKEII